jgi:hypothetical protein
VRREENGGLTGRRDDRTIAVVAGKLLDHPELRALCNFGVAEEQLQRFQVLFLPENLTTASCREKLIDAGDMLELARRLRGFGVHCATSYDLTPEAKTVARRGDDLWLGIVWILQGVVLPLFITTLGTMLNSLKQNRFKADGAHPQPKAHLKLRISRGEDAAEIDYSGDPVVLSRLLEGLKSGWRAIE